MLGHRRSTCLRSSSFSPFVSGAVTGGDTSRCILARDVMYRSLWESSRVPGEGAILREISWQAKVLVRLVFAGKGDGGRFAPERVVDGSAFRRCSASFGSSSHAPNRRHLGSSTRQKKPSRS